MKKTSLAKKVAGSKDSSQPPSDKESDNDKQKKQAAVKEKGKPMGKGGFDAYQGAQGGEQAGPSHEGWPACLSAVGAAGVKHVAPSQSPKKVVMKVVQQIQMQQRVQQQAMHPAQMCIFLPSAPAGIPKHQNIQEESRCGQ